MAKKYIEKIACAFFILIVALQANAQNALIPYSDLSRFIFSPPDGEDIGLYGALNPAILTYSESPDLLFLLSSPGNFSSLDEWGLFWAAPGIGLSVFGEKKENNNWQHRIDLSTGFGNRLFSAGLGIECSPSGTGVFDPTSAVTLGFLIRPTVYLSTDMFTRIAFNGTDQEYVAALGIRPFGDKSLTLSCDYAIENPSTWERLFGGVCSVSAVFEPPFLDGLSVGGRFYPQTLDFSIGIHFSMGITGFTTQAHFLGNGSFDRSTLALRMGQVEPGFLPDLADKDDKYLVMDLGERIGYNSGSFFNRTQSLFTLLSDIDTAKEDSSIKGCVINLTGIGASYDFLWELRQKLVDFKSSGKKVIVFIEDCNLEIYYLASVADKIVSDPFATIGFDGFLSGNSYYKDLLDKLGVGFSEIRLYDYKSAFETFSRTSMSEKEKEQETALLNDFYDVVKGDIKTSRSISDDEFSALLNRKFIISAKDAVSQKLIDDLGRWNDREKLVNESEKHVMTFVKRNELKEYNKPFEKNWGETPKIALVYATGVVDMDSGMNIRNLVTIIDDIGKNPFISAVVVRVDSPGGSALAAEALAQSIAACAKVKPVVVSMGRVAASGGYWISTPATTVCASPFTITGSIGVAGAWIYDKGLKEKIGVSTDLVKIGDHADMGFGFLLPFVNIGLPDRDLSPDERAVIEANMRYVYKEFVNKVSSDRGLPRDKVEECAQGHIWSGRKAAGLRLVDETGGLSRAIEIAKQKAGIPVGKKTEIIELPVQTPFMSLLSLLRFFDIKITEPVKSDFVIDYFKFRIQNNGRPLAILDIGDFTSISGRLTF